MSGIPPRRQRSPTRPRRRSVRSDQRADSRKLASAHAWCQSFSHGDRAPLRRARAYHPPPIASRAASTPRSTIANGGPELVLARTELGSGPPPLPLRGVPEPASRVDEEPPLA